MFTSGGRWISFNDGWLPADLNYEICGPERSRFKAVNMSASGSTFFIMNKFGDMFTTIWDYDLSGPNTEFRRYSYYDQTGIENPAHQLPPAPWTKHPKIIGKITDLISLHKVGMDCLHRTMRVEGTDAGGNTGYYEKDITGTRSEDWVFHRTGLPLRGQIIENMPGDMSGADLGESEDLDYSRNMDKLASLKDVGAGSELTDADWAGELLDFSCYCSPATIRVHLAGGSSFDLVLHTTEMLRQKEKQGRGLDNGQREKNGAIEIPKELWDNLENIDAQTRLFIKKYFTERITDVRVRATLNKVRISKQGILWDFTR